jgi:uncharacterized metal-binding protein YceD (DUF177 family)
VFERDIFELDAKDLIQPAGNVRYDILVEIDKDSLILSGKLVAPMRLRCVKCLEEFPCTVELDDYLSEFDLEEDFEGAETIELSVPLREDLLLATPAYPHCDRDGDDPDRICPRSDEELAFESTPANGAQDEAPDEPPSQWAALDQLNQPGESD